MNTVAIKVTLTARIGFENIPKIDSVKELLFSKSESLSRHCVCEPVLEIVFSYAIVSTCVSGFVL